MFSWLLIVLLTIVVIWSAVLSLFFSLSVVAGLRETMMVWPFEPVDVTSPARPVVDFDAANPYAPSAALNDTTRPSPTRSAIQAADEATLFGFTPLGTFRDVRGGIYRMRYDLWLGPGGVVLAVIATGTVITLVAEVTALQTRLADQTRLTTLNDQRGSAVDLTGSIAEALIPGASFADLLAAHRDRVRGSGTAVAPYPTDPAAALAEYRSLAITRVAALEARGLIAFVGPDRNAYRHTPRGSLARAWRMYAQFYRRKIRPDHRAPIRPTNPTARDGDSFMGP